MITYFFQVPQQNYSILYKSAQQIEKGAMYSLVEIPPHGTQSRDTAYYPLLCRETDLLQACHPKLTIYYLC